MTRPFVEKTVEKAFLLSDRVWPFSAEPHAEGIKSGFVGVLEAAQVGARSHRHRTHVSLFEAYGIP